MLCKICQKEFTPSKYRPAQKVCSGPECQKIRQIQNVREWRIRNLDYFRCNGGEFSWREARRLQSKRWRQNHKSQLREYRENHRQQRREYMREYIRRYRERLSGATLPC